MPEFGFHSGDREWLVLFEDEGAVTLGLFRGEEFFHLVHEHGIRHDIFHVMEDLLYFIGIGWVGVIVD